MKIAVRRLLRAPAFAATAVVSLALGIGANTAIFSLVDAILLEKPPLAQPEELVELYIEDPDFAYQTFSYPDFVDLREATGAVFEGVVGTQLALAQANREGGIEVLPSEMVSANYFSLLGIEPRLGRGFLPEEDSSPGGHPVVVLGHGYWQRTYGGDPHVLGRTLLLSGRPYEIVGVAAEEYTGTLRGLVPDLFLPIVMLNQIQPAESDQLASRGNHSVFVKARLADGVSLERAAVELEGLAAELRQSVPEEWSETESFRLVPSEEVILYPPFDRFLRASAVLLLVVVGLVLIITCANLASFLLARGTDRRKDLAVRMSLGATRGRLVRELMAETLLLALVGGMAGLAVAAALTQALVRADLPLPIPVTLDLSLDGSVLLYSLLVTVAAGLLFGVAPALQATRRDISSAIRQETAGAGGAGRLRLRNALVAAQVAVALVLIIGAGLFLRSFQQVREVDPGFGGEPSAIVTLGLPSERYDRRSGLDFYRRLEERISQIPGVEAVGTMSNLHLNTLSTSTTGVTVDGVEPPPGQREHSIDVAEIDGELFSALGIRLLEGREFEPGDDADAPSVAIVSQAMARRFWPDETAVGKRYRTGSGEEVEVVEVVGVAADAKVRTLGEAPRPFVYLPFAQNYAPITTVVARTDGDASQLALTLLATARELEPELWTWEAKTMERHLGIVLLPARLSAAIIGAFAALALALAAIGVYGLMSYAVSRRSREVGIRMALGADRRTIVTTLVAGGLRLVLAGAAVGLLLSLLLTRALSELLFGVGALDPISFLGAPLLLVSVAVLAAAVPARRAARIHPAQTLRSE